MYKTGLVHIYTGDGQGKTSAAIGLAIRARGAGLDVLLAQMFKNESSENKILKEIGVRLMQYNSKHPFFKKYSAAELDSEAKKCSLFLAEAFKAAKKKEYHLLIVDELGPAMNYNLVTAKQVLELIKDKPPMLELVLTGRGFPEEIIKIADYVSEIKMISHPYEKGILARKGIDC